MGPRVLYAGPDSELGAVDFYHATILSNLGLGVTRRTTIRSSPVASRALLEGLVFAQSKGHLNNGYLFFVETVAHDMVVLVVIA